MFQRTAQ
jgi:frataxin-like iron-binding protein CyaY